MHEELIQGLRNMADFLATHDVPDIHIMPFNVFVKDADDLKARVKGMGLVTKEAWGDYFILKKDFGGQIRIEWTAERKQVCERVVKERIVHPAKPARTVELEAEPEKVEEIVEWVCPESILANGQEQAAKELLQEMAKP